MQIIINILAGIGALTVLSAVWVIVVIMMEAHKEKKREVGEEKRMICALTGENCIFLAEIETCTGCPIAEERGRYERK